MKSSQRLESFAFYSFIITTILVVLAFVPSIYLSSDLVKSIVISFGTLATAVPLALLMYQERKLVLAPRKITWTVLLLTLSLIISTLVSPNTAKAFFGQGFETGTASFVLLLIVSSFAALTLVNRRPERAGIILMTLSGSYIVLFIYHTLRFIFGPSFAQFSIFGTYTSTLFGTWSSLGVFSLFIAISSLCAVIFLPLSKQMKLTYTALAILATFGGFIVNVTWALMSFSVVLAGICVHLFLNKKKSENTSLISSIPWLPAIILIISVATTFWGASVTSFIANKINAGYSELALPWQMTLDIASGVIKESPLFGVGPNHFGQAFLAYKPAAINATDAWNVEFGSGVGTIPTFFVTQGLVGGLLWLLLLIFFGVLGLKSLKRLPENQYGKFIIVTSFAATAFSWITLLAYTPSHAFLFIAAISTGIWLGSSIHYGALEGSILSTHESTSSLGKLVPIITGAVLILLIVWSLVYIKKTVALAYFTSGVKHLNKPNPNLADIVTADKSFGTAIKIDPSDIYWQARTETSLAKIRLLGTALNSPGQASTTDIAKDIAATLDLSLKYANEAIAINPRNYYNYLYAARVSEMAMNFKIPNAYEAALKSYVDAANFNPYNPSLYLNVARIQASQGKYNEALQAIGAALQVKRNYTDAAFMASQVAAAQGNIKDAIIAARLATQLSPNAPLVYFQLGILLYTDKDYTGAVESLSNAVRLQADYANARYFLGLSQARLGKMADALTQFTELKKSNPDNQEINLILNNLQTGRSPFADAVPPITPTPEKRSTLPIKEKTGTKTQ